MTHANIHTPLQQAVEEIQRRRRDQNLLNEVAKFLDNDIPLHFNNRQPIFYLSRYIATPDYETLQFIEQVKKYHFPIVIGEDPDDILTSHSSLKRNLVKLPVILGTAKNGSGILEYISIADLNAEQGKRLKEVTTHNQLSLTTFHRKLSKKFFPSSVSIANESDWVSRHHRGQLSKLYESMLSLFIFHGIMLEYYEHDEVEFLIEVVEPAFVKTKQRFGCVPLIAPLEIKHSEKIRDINSYPAEVKLEALKACST